MAMNELIEKIEFFLDNKIKIHIDLRDGTFLNGYLIKKIKDDVYWLNEDKLGEIFLFVKDIFRLQQNLKREENESKI